jgi:NAD(P)-dependent dehydrogenase (short-subunit alcohol dehydrogenase family)
MTLINKNVLITGANSGIGFSACLLFAKRKSKILAVDISPEINDDLKLKLKSLGVDFQYFQCDVSDSAKVNGLFQVFESDRVVIDILINNAGILGPRKKVVEYSDEDFDNVIDVNVKGVFYFMKAALKVFIAHKKGVIVNTASVAGHFGMVGHIAYSASKHAVMGMTKTAALEVAKYNIRINAVCPGFTQTAMLSSADTEPDYLETLKFVTPMKRFGESSEIASAILFLASDESSFMTGQSIILDGGLSAQ